MKAIAIVDKDWNIGKDDKLLFNLPTDLKRFQEITKGKLVIMGSKTLDSMGKPLPHRTNIVLSSKELPKRLPWDPIVRINSIDELFLKLDDYFSDTYTDDEVFVIGGGNVYEQLVPYCNEVYLTMVDARSNGNVKFPELDENEWSKVEDEPHHDNGISYSFTKWVRNME